MYVITATAAGIFKKVPCEKCHSSRGSCELYLSVTLPISLAKLPVNTVFPSVESESAASRAGVLGIQHIVYVWPQDSFTVNVKGSR